MDSSSYGVKAELEHTFLSDSNSKDGVNWEIAMQECEVVHEKMFRNKMQHERGGIGAGEVQGVYCPFTHLKPEFSEQNFSVAKQTTACQLQRFYFCFLKLLLTCWEGE